MLEKVRKIEANNYYVREATKEERERLEVSSDEFVYKLFCKNINFIKQKSSERVIAYFIVETNEEGKKKANVIETEEKTLTDNRTIEYYKDYLTR